MGIRKIGFIAAVAMLVLLLGLVSGAFAQEPVEAAFVRGHFSEGDGVWRADDFGWFYYDLDKDQGGEELRIDLEGRTAEEGHIVYSSKTWTRQFEYEPWGSFEMVAFFGKPYFAGYSESNFTEEVSSLGKGELRYLFIDEDRTQTLSSNSTFALQQGYVLVAAEVSEKNGVVNFFLLKNGKPVYASVVSIGDTFVYKVDDVPVILVHLANAMRSDDEGLAEIDGIFQISDTPSIKLFDGGRLGNMKLTDHTEEGIEFQNNNSLTFSRDSEIPLTAELRIVVLDLPTPVYYPIGGIFDYGVHEIRGPVFNASSSIPTFLGKYNSSAAAKWDSSNYGGFYFDPESMVGAEHFAIHRIQDRVISPARKATTFEENNTAIQSGLQYTSIIQAKDFEYKPWGHYFVIGFPGTSQPWFAGYDSVLEGGKSSKSLLEHEYLGFVLLDLELGNRILAGNYSLDEGYEMRIRDVDDDSIFIQLLKNGITVDGSVVKSNSTYVYKKDLNDIDDMPIIMAHFSSIFDDGKERFATIDGIFQISDQFLLPIEPGRGMGELEVVNVLPDKIIMVNPDRITLNSNSNINIGPGMNIHVADNDTLRYYLYSSEYVVPAPEPPLINAQDNVSSFASANVSIIVKAAEISQVMGSILDSSNRTVFSRDITRFGQGSGDLWGFAWKWNATTLQLSDDKSLI
ncbi:MAG: hypothetical protein JW999_12465, partial [Methanotrichaceae archaeon]|nr:hypothetical protein [Methanotrichaceae archaeon]